jgi:hypothetical protein
MNKIREWGFPVGLAIAWIVASGYTMSVMAQKPAPVRVERART